jgi:hypothetical protein
MNVYISHAYADAELARKVGRALREAGFEVWDGLELFPGDNWLLKQGEALRDADAMVLLLTPEYLRSYFVEADLGFALVGSQFKDRLVPVVVGPEEQLPEGGIPWVLARLRIIHWPDPDGDENGLEQIVAALQEAPPSARVFVSSS